MNEDELEELKSIENEGHENGSSDTMRSSDIGNLETFKEALKITVPFDDAAVNTINDCLEGITADKVDVLELSYEILEALIRKHGTKAEILAHKDDYESIMHLFHQSVIDAFKDAIHKINILSEAQIEEIKKIIEA